jgi:acyl dehydratase
MAPVAIEGIEGLKQIVDQEVGPSDWLEVTQEDIDRFAQVSRDFQWIHVDRERAQRESPYGTTIAHGNLTLSLIDGFRSQLFQQDGVAMGINYGWNRVRFPAPVPSGSRVRARATVLSVDELDGGWFQVVTRFEVEREGEDKPVCVADSVGRFLPG